MERIARYKSKFTRTKWPAFLTHWQLSTQHAIRHETWPTHHSSKLVHICMQAPARARQHKMDVSQYVQRTTVSPLFAAIERGDVEATENSLLAGANPSEIDKYNKSGETVDLMGSACFGFQVGLETMLSSKGSIRIHSRFLHAFQSMRTCRMHSNWKRMPTSATLPIISDGCACFWIRVYTIVFHVHIIPSGRSPLHVASKLGNDQIVRLLCSCDASVGTTLAWVTET